MSPPAAISEIDLQKPDNVSGYLFFELGQNGTDLIVLGFDLGKGTTAPWQLDIHYNAADRIVPQETPAGIHVKAVPELNYIAYSGRLATPAHSYTELKGGLYHYTGPFQLTTGLPTDAIQIRFKEVGTVSAVVIAGPDVAISMPTLNDLSGQSVSIAVSRRTRGFSSELAYNAGYYENLTGGPQILDGTIWDWLTGGQTIGRSATGTNNAQAESDQAHLFAAGALLGLAGAALATFCVEFVGAVTERRKTSDEDAGSGDVNAELVEADP